MLSFSAITPHSPLLVPAVGKENFELFKQTTTALETLEQEVYTAKIETLIIITPHGQIHDSSFVINFSPKFQGNFEEFAEFTTKPEYYGDNELSYRIKEKLETTHPLQLTTVDKIDFGCLVPLHYLMAHNKTIRVIPISISKLSYEKHYKFGQALTDMLHHSPKRIGVIASVGLSHKLSKKSPNGYAPQAKKFDQKIIELIKKKDVANLIATDPSLVEKVDAQDFPAILILLGIISNINYHPKLLSYEYPLGAGQLTMNLEM